MNADDQQATGSPIWFSSQAGVLRRIGKIVFFLLVCAYFGYCYASHPSFLNLSLYTQGRAVTPYQYRILPMFVFRALLHSGAFLRLASHIHPLNDDPFRLVMAVLGFTGLLGAMLATMGTLRRLTHDRIFAFWASMMVAYMALVDLASSWNDPFTTPYDVPSLMFFSVAMNLVLRRGWWMYYPVFILAVLNRETACLITVFFAVWEWFRLAQLGRTAAARIRSIAPHFLVQVLLWLTIKVMLSRHFRANATEIGGHAGGLFITHFAYNLRELLKPQQWPLLLSICGFSLPFLWLQRRFIGNQGLAWAIAIILPLSFAGLMIVGVIVEIRIFSDWIALVVPALALILHGRFQPRPTALSEA